MNNQPSSYLVPQKEDTTIDVRSDFPQELICGILLGLPVNCLCRFKCVSKSFCAIIDMQLEHMRRRKLIFKEIGNYPKTTAFYVCDIDDGLEQKIILRNQKKQSLYLCSDYNGLFLLSDGYSNFVLWNPFTKQYRNLPACPIERTYIHKCKMGLGYDSASDDHKVVLIHWRTAWIFALKENSWRRIDDEFFTYAGLGWSESAYFAHGHLHWLYKPPIPDRHVDFHEQEIFAFDVLKEKFSQVVQPDYPVEGHITDLYVLDGCLCVGFLSHTTVQEVHLYVRNKDGDDYTWHNMCSVTFHQPLLSLGVEHFDHVKIVGYSKGGDKILLDIWLDTEWDFEWKYMISCDLKRKVIEKIDVPAGYGTGRMFDESLVSVGVASISAWKPFKEIIYDQTGD